MWKSLSSFWASYCHYLGYLKISLSSWTFFWWLLWLKTCWSLIWLMEIGTSERSSRSKVPIELMSSRSIAESRFSGRRLCSSSSIILFVTKVSFKNNFWYFLRCLIPTVFENRSSYGFGSSFILSIWSGLISFTEKEERNLKGQWFLKLTSKCLSASTALGSDFWTDCSDSLQSPGAPLSAQSPSRWCWSAHLPIAWLLGDWPVCSAAERNWEARPFPSRSRLTCRWSRQSCSGATYYWALGCWLSASRPARPGRWRRLCAH